MSTKNPETASSKATTDRITSRMRDRRPVPPEFDSPNEERRWYAEQAKIENDYRAALAKYPPGSKVYAATRGIPRRSRAGVAFSDKGRTEVEVVDLTDEEIGKIKAGDDSILGTIGEGENRRPDPLAVRLRSGAAIVGPMGAKAIDEDDGLVVFTESAKESDPERDDEIEALRKQIAAKDAELAKLRKENAAAERKASNPAAPQRLPATSGDFGDTDKPKS